MALYMTFVAFPIVFQHERGWYHCRCTIQLWNDIHVSGYHELSD